MTQCTCNCLSPFLWQKHPRPSIFSSDRVFAASADGLSTSQRATQAAQEYEAKHGRSQGTVHGVSSAADRATLEFCAKRARAAAQDRKAA